MKPLPELDPRRLCQAQTTMLSSMLLLDSRGGTPVVMVALGAVEVATSSSFRCLEASPHRGMVSGLASQGGLLVCILLPLHCEGCFSKPQCLTEGTLGSLRSAAQALRPECALATSRAVSRLPALGTCPYQASIRPLLPTREASDRCAK